MGSTHHMNPLVAIRRASINPGKTGTMAAPVVRRRVLISGRVQGVWFRQACLNSAETAGVHGWVRNLSDGRVEAVFEGAENAVSSMVDWVMDGPPRAEVMAVELIEEDPLGDRDFRII